MTTQGRNEMTTTINSWNSVDGGTKHVIGCSQTCTGSPPVRECQRIAAECPNLAPVADSQHARDSAELRRLCQARDDARRQRDLLAAEVADLRAQLAAVGAGGVSGRLMGAQPTLAVWFGSMPESNGKANWTAILYRKDDTKLFSFAEGITIERSEYKDRVRYEADRLRFLIGEIAESPDILAYDPSLKSAPSPLPPTAQPAEPADPMQILIDTSQELGLYGDTSSGCLISDMPSLYEQLRSAIDGGSESMTHADALEQIAYWVSLEEKVSQPQKSTPDSEAENQGLRLLKVVTALSAQSGESVDLIVDWLSKGALVEMVLTRFSPPAVQQSTPAVPPMPEFEVAGWMHSLSDVATAWPKGTV